MASIFNAHGTDDSHDSPSGTRTPSPHKYPPTQKKIWSSLSNLIFIHNRNICKRKICKRKGGHNQIMTKFKVWPYIMRTLQSMRPLQGQNVTAFLACPIASLMQRNVTSTHIIRASKSPLDLARPWGTFSLKKGVIPNAQGALASFCSSYCFYAW